MQLLWSMFSTRKTSPRTILRAQYTRSMYYLLRCHKWGFWSIALACILSALGAYDSLLAVLLFGALAATPFPWVLYCSTLVWDSFQE